MDVNALRGSHPAISSLGRLRTPAVGVRGAVVMAGIRKRSLAAETAAAFFAAPGTTVIGIAGPVYLQGDGLGRTAKRIL